MRIKRETLFLALYTLYIIGQVLSASQFADMAGVGLAITGLRYACMAALAGLIVTHPLGFKGKTVPVQAALLVAAVVNMLFCNGGVSLVYLLLVAYASRGVSLEKLCRVTFYATLFSYLFVMLSSQIGIIEDMVDVRYIGKVSGSFFKGEYVRHSFGFLVSNQVPVTFLFLYLTLVVWKKNALPHWVNGVTVLLNWVVFRLCGSRIVFGLTLLSVALYYFVAMKRLLRIQTASSKRRPGIFFLVFPACAAISFGTGWLYRPNSSLFTKLDLLFNNRVSMAGEALRYYGLTLFGLGKQAGTYEGEYNIKVGLNTVDNGYILMFLQWGILIGMILLLGWSVLTDLAARKQNTYLLIVLCMLAAANLINSDLVTYRAVMYYCVLFNAGDPWLEGERSLYVSGIRCLFRKGRTRNRILPEAEQLTE